MGRFPPAWFEVYAIYMAIGFAALLFSYFGIKERVIPDAKSIEKVRYSDLFITLKNNRPMQILGLFFLLITLIQFLYNTTWPFYMQYNLDHSEWIATIGLIGTIADITIILFWNKIANAIGKKNFFYTFLGVLIVGLLCTFMWQFDGFNSSPIVGYIGRILTQCGMVATSGFLWCLVPDVVTYNEYTSNKRVAAVINSLVGLFFKTGMAIGGVVPGFILAIYGFNGSLETQSASALFGISMAMIWVPIIVTIVAMVVIHFYPLTNKEVERMNKEIALRNANQ